MYVIFVMQDTCFFALFDSLSDRDKDIDGMLTVCTVYMYIN